MAAWVTCGWLKPWYTYLLSSLAKFLLLSVSHQKLRTGKRNTCFHMRSNPQNPRAIWWVPPLPPSTGSSTCNGRQTAGYWNLKPRRPHHTDCKQGAFCLVPYQKISDAHNTCEPRHAVTLLPPRRQRPPPAWRGGTFADPHQLRTSLPPSHAVRCSSPLQQDMGRQCQPSHQGKPGMTWLSHAKYENLSPISIFIRFFMWLQPYSLLPALTQPLHGPPPCF